MKEIRTIVFDPAEVQAALVDQSRRRGASFPWQASVESVVLDERSGVATLVLVDDHGFESRLEFDAEDITGALIVYCLRRRVPLPSRGDKRFQVIEGGFALFISYPDNQYASVRPDIRREAA